MSSTLNAASAPFVPVANVAVRPSAETTDSPPITDARDPLSSIAVSLQTPNASVPGCADETV